VALEQGELEAAVLALRRAQRFLCDGELEVLARIRARTLAEVKRRRRGGVR
jgi:hypothetical protein